MNEMMRKFLVPLTIENHYSTGHDRTFARWTGIWPGYAESRALGMDLNDLYTDNVYKIFFTKPKTDRTDINELIDIVDEAKELIEIAVDYLGRIKL